MENEISYLVFDERYITQEPPEDAPIMVACDSLEDARSYRGDYGDHCAIYRVGDGDETLVEVLSVNKKIKTVKDYRNHVESELYKMGKKGSQTKRMMKLMGWYR